MGGEVDSSVACPRSQPSKATTNIDRHNFFENIEGSELGVGVHTNRYRTDNATLARLKDRFHGRGGRIERP